MTGPPWMEQSVGLASGPSQVVRLSSRLDVLDDFCSGGTGVCWLGRPQLTPAVPRARSDNDALADDWISSSLARAGGWCSAGTSSNRRAGRHTRPASRARCDHPQPSYCGIHCDATTRARKSSSLAAGATASATAAFATAVAISTAVGRSSPTGGSSVARGSRAAGESAPSARAPASNMPSVTRRALEARMPKTHGGEDEDVVRLRDGHPFAVEFERRVRRAGGDEYSPVGPPSEVGRVGLGARGGIGEWEDDRPRGI
jgi:hypothetical protein